MTRSPLSKITIETAKKVYKGSYIDDEIILFDEFADVPLPSEPRRMGCLLLALCLKGKAQYTVDTEIHQVESGDIIIISEGQVVDNYMLSRDCSGIALMVSYDFFNEAFQGVSELSALFLFARTHPVCPLLPKEVDTFTAYFKIIKEKADNKEHHFRIELARTLFKAMIYDLSNGIYRFQQMKGKNCSRAESIFRDFIRLVEQNFKEERRVGWYAQQLCITPKYLSESIKQMSHRTPNEWIDNYVLMEIRVLLKNTTKSIKEITMEMNFPTQSFLGKFFKEHMGMSPSDYRRS